MHQSHLQVVEESTGISDLLLQLLKYKRTSIQESEEKANHIKNNVTHHVHDIHLSVQGVLIKIKMMINGFCYDHTLFISFFTPFSHACYHLTVVTLSYLSLFTSFSIFVYREISDTAKSNSNALIAHHMLLTLLRTAMHLTAPLIMTMVISSLLVVTVYADSLVLDITHPWTLILHPSELPVWPGTWFHIFFPAQLATVKATLGELIKAHPNMLHYLFQSASPSLNIWVAMPHCFLDILDGTVMLVSLLYIHEAVQHWILVWELLMEIGTECDLGKWVIGVSCKESAWVTDGLCHSCAEGLDFSIQDVRFLYVL